MLIGDRFRLWESDRRRLQVIQRSLNHAIIFFEVDEQMMPENLPTQNFRIADYDQTVLGSGQSHILNKLLLHKMDLDYWITRRRGSFRKPIPPDSLERTQVTMIMSFSRPCNIFVD
jgi:hypothetical protein